MSITVKDYRGDVKYRAILAVHFDPSDSPIVAKLRAKGLSATDIGVLASAPRVDDEQLILNSLAFTFRPAGPYAAGRFNTGSFPALYTTKKVETAERELRHHVVAKKPTKSVPYVVFSIKFQGKLADLRPEVSSGKLHLHDNDYTPTQAIAEDCRSKALAEGLVAPSVRCPDGSCCAIFVRTGIMAVEVVKRGDDIALPT